MKLSLSKITLLIIALVLLVTTLNIKRWENHKTITSDVTAYYTYLPGVFIYHDLKFKYMMPLNIKYKGKIFWLNELEDGSYVDKCWIGMSILYTPFFLVGHTYASLSHDYPADGYSIPYQVAIQFSGVFYAFLGLYFLMLLLKMFYSEKVSSLVVLTIFFATNLFYYSTTEAALTHSISFFLFSALLYYSLQWFKSGKLKSAAIIAVLSGIIVLVRPTNLLFFLVPLLYLDKIEEGLLSAIKHKINWIKAKLPQLAFMVLIAGLIVFPQFLYWKFATGNWVYYSYAGESFFFDNPHIMDGLFSYRKGWLVYTPIMAFALLGIFFLRRKLAAWRIGIIVYMVINIYVTYSWWCWWYGGSFGARTMVDCYGLLAIPLGAIYSRIAKISDVLKTVSLILLAGFIYLNLFQTLQKRYDIIHYEGMTKRTFWMIIGKLYNPPNYWENIEIPDYKNAYKGIKERKIDPYEYNIKSSITVREENFNEKIGPFIEEGGHSPPFACKVSRNFIYSPALYFPFKDLKISKKNYSKFRVSLYIKRKAWWSKAVLITQIERPDVEVLVYQANRLYDVSDDWEMFYFNVDIPEYYHPETRLSVYVGNEGKGAVLIDDLKIELLEISKH